MARIRKTVPYSGTCPHREHRSKKGRRYIKSLGKIKIYRREKEELKLNEEESLL